MKLSEFTKAKRRTDGGQVVTTTENTRVEHRGHMIDAFIRFQPRSAKDASLRAAAAAAEKIRLRLAQPTYGASGPH